MMNGYAMSGWGWLLMTLGLLGFWALIGGCGWAGGWGRGAADPR